MTAGSYSLTRNGAASDLAIAGAGTIICEEVGDLDGASEIDVQQRFIWGSGGATLKSFLQTSLDQGTTWIDLWCFAAGTASKIRVRSLKSSQGTELTPTDGTLADDTAASPIVLGDRVRLKVVTTGTYGGSSALASRMQVR